MRDKDPRGKQRSVRSSRSGAGDERTVRPWGLGFRVQGSEFRVQGSGFRVQGS